MRITCGTDIIEIERIKESIDSLQNKFLREIFTEKEIAYCESKKNMKYQHYAVRFAAKEAIFKAISSHLQNKFQVSWTDAEILDDTMGKPNVHFLGITMDKLKDIQISLSHCKEYAVANVVASWEE